LPEELANKLGYELDKKGISICSVAGTNFAPYVKFLKCIGTPFTIITDRDPLDLPVPLGVTRIDKLLELIVPAYVAGVHPEVMIILTGQAQGIFTNTQTLETELINSPVLKTIVCDILLEEHGERQRVGPTIEGWRNNQRPVDMPALLRYIEEIGKGRFAKRLSNRLPNGQCPQYIISSFEYITNAT
jgi:putative ATP-dependent endonuclease of OLD family